MSVAEAFDSGKVLQFRSTQASPASTTLPLNWPEILGAPDLKALIEGAVLNAYLRASVTTPSAVGDNPFDPVYISELRPDRIDEVDRAAYGRVIQDLSSNIAFNDGWDD